MSDDRIEADWLADPDLQQVLGVLSADGEQARVVGGAIRNTLMGHPVTDIDIATTALPAETMRRLTAAGIKAVDTGMEHGTVTAVIHHKGFEVTTLREDVETDGRRAVVEFGRSWRHDAERRDFTINALYADAQGQIFDLVGGRADIESRTVRFIGEAEARIREDYLRILRFFRFFAWYGDGRPDAEGLKACARLRQGAEGLSAERVWAEMRRLLDARDPTRALLWMRQSGVLSLVLPESEKWGIDGIHGLMAAERAFSWTPDAVLRLMTLMPLREATVRGLAKRWKVANVVRDRLVAAARIGEFDPATPLDALERVLYRADRQAVIDRLRLAIARHGPHHDATTALAALLAHAQAWQRPDFPVRGKDLLARGHPAGPGLGETLRALEDAWVESGFALDRARLLEMAEARA
ncbi:MULTISPECIES: CCA tRNA nucleotidyltransferase [unclassified Roseitalea]|uniref:CCA tRNA nucleotidyltransferase n=1 Tax=unclassified Roseitalea TaxID=2639107 RepID=UPI00273E1498|nr:MULTISPECIES: CCA tRNA nucleotidyltransferase [unclassified Roseitalea]